MTKGVVIFAFANEQCDYVKLAEWNAGRIKQWLDLPTCIITDQPRPNSPADKIIVVPRPQGQLRTWTGVMDKTQWFNCDRSSVYHLSPYDVTLLLDADYVVGSDFLRAIIDAASEFSCYRHAWAVGGQALEQHIGAVKFPLWWATVIKFQRCAVSQYVFDAMTMIQNHWQHYRDLYKISQPLFRNDYALSIALTLTAGHTTGTQDIPGSMMTVLPGQDLDLVNHNRFSVKYHDQKNKAKTCWLENTDFHCMDKKSLDKITANEQ